MRVLFAASEAEPFASTGGLADVAGSLPSALCSKGHDVRVVIPLYSQINQEYRNSMQFICSFSVKLGWRYQYCGIFSAVYKNVTFYFIDNKYYFERQRIYGEYDDAERFAFFSKAILELMAHIDFFPDILHTNDWQTALAGIYLKQKYHVRPEYAKIKLVQTIHNIEYQGKYGFELFSDLFELDPPDYEIVEFNGDINLLKGSIVCSDRITTVSPRYADEIKLPEYSYSLDPILNRFYFKLCGILNGIDQNYYDPNSGQDIFAAYSANNTFGKLLNKKSFQFDFSLPERTEIPLIAVISRLVQPKGIDLIIYVIDELLKRDIQFVLLGSGNHAYEEYFHSLEYRHRDKVRCIIGYNKKLSKKIYAASDIFLMPSVSEPCGLSQMIAARYGSIPIVHETGGLFNSIKSYNKFTGEGNGFSFYACNAHDMKHVINEALDIFIYRKDEWKQLMYNAMTSDFSWNKSSEAYIELYHEIM